MMISSAFLEAYHITPCDYFFEYFVAAPITLMQFTFCFYLFICNFVILLKQQNIKDKSKKELDF